MFPNPPQPSKARFSSCNCRSGSGIEPLRAALPAFFVALSVFGAAAQTTPSPPHTPPIHHRPYPAHSLDRSRFAGRSHLPAGPGRTGVLHRFAPRSGLKITSSARLAPGEYHLTDPGYGAIEVVGKNIVLDCAGVKVEGHGSGYGIRVHDSDNVTIKNLATTGFLWGVVVDRSTHVYIRGCTSSHNADLPTGTTIDASGREPQDTHGGGFLIRHSQHCQVTSCLAQREWDGLAVVSCQNNSFMGNDFGSVSNFGAHFWNSSHNTYLRNRSVWCVPGKGWIYQRDGSVSGQSAAAVCLERSSDYNLIDSNDLRFSRGGICIRANEGPATPGQVVPPLHPSDHNLVRSNDCSFSVHNAIEADLCDENTFLFNNCSHSDYGFWLGYSRKNWVAWNTIVGCASRGIQIENGQNNVIQCNTLINPPGKPLQSLIYLYQNGRDNTPSGPYRLVGNAFIGSVQPVKLIKTPVTASGNRVPSSSSAIFFGDPNSPITSGDTPALPDEPMPRVDRVSPSPIPVGCGVGVLSTGPSETLRPTPGETLPPLHSTRLTLFGSRLVAPAEQQEKVGDREVWITAPPVVEIGGVPALLLDWQPDRVDVAVPDDFWDRPLKDSAPLRIFNGQQFVNAGTVTPDWVSPAPGVRSISSTAPGHAITITGIHLQGPADDPPTVYLDGKPVHVVNSSPTLITFKAPPGPVSSQTYNMVILTNVESIPYPLEVVVPPAWEPHIIAATFTPDQLRPGDLLHVRVVVKNNAPYPLSPGDPGSGHVYAEKESFVTQHIPEPAGTIFVRVTSDITGASWPYLWALPRAAPPGETVEVDGDIRVQTPGTTRYRVGLVDAGARWIDRDLFPTTITVSPSVTPE